MIVIIFPDGSLQDVVKIARRNYFRACRLRKLPVPVQLQGQRHRRRSTVINHSAYIHTHRRNITLEELAKFLDLQKHYSDVLQLAEDLRIQIPSHSLLNHVMVKVIFENTWYLKSSPWMRFLRWIGALKDIKRLIADVLQYQGITIRPDHIQIIETQFSLEEWFWKSTEGNVLDSVLNKWGFFREPQPSSLHVSERSVSMNR